MANPFSLLRESLQRASAALQRYNEVQQRRRRNPISSHLQAAAAGAAEAARRGAQARAPRSPSPTAANFRAVEEAQRRPRIPNQGKSLQDLTNQLLTTDPTGTAGPAHLLDPKTGLPSVALPYEPEANIFEQGVRALQRDPAELERFRKLAPEKQQEVRKNVREGDKVKASTVQQMQDAVAKDPMQDPERKSIMDDLAAGFREESRFKYFTDDDLVDNPFLRAMNDLSAWSEYRIKVADWYAGKRKGGDVTALPSTDEAGDGTFTGLVDGGSQATASSVASLSNLPPYLVIRDEHGLLTIVDKDQWVNAKFAEMHRDPGFAAQIITALAGVSEYGTAASAKAQADRIIVDKDGNPVKAIPSSEDRAALDRFANRVIILQTQGEEWPIDDILEEEASKGLDLAAQIGDEYDSGGGGGGRRFRRGGGGGFGGFGGGFGGGGSAIDPALLGVIGDSIGRQRAGRSLTADEKARLVQFFSAQAPGANPEAQVIAWVEANLGQEIAANQYGQLAATFMSMMAGSNPFGGIT